MTSTTYTRNTATTKPCVCSRAHAAKQAEEGRRNVPPSIDAKPLDQRLSASAHGRSSSRKKMIRARSTGVDGGDRLALVWALRKRNPEYP